LGIHHNLSHLISSHHFASPYIWLFAFVLNAKFLFVKYFRVDFLAKLPWQVALRASDFRLCDDSWWLKKKNNKKNMSFLQLVNAGVVDVLVATWNRQLSHFTSLCNIKNLLSTPPFETHILHNVSPCILNVLKRLPYSLFANIYCWFYLITPKK